jgi:hypothetical protein
VLLVPKEAQELKELQALRVQLEHRVLLEHKEQLALKVFKEILVILVLKEQ